MRVAIGYKKTGAARYVAHLDLQRALTRAFKRAKLPLAFSQGFHPHALVSLASALPVGAQGLDEWMEAVLTEEIDPGILRARLDAALPEGLEINSAVRLPDTGKSLMALAARVDWTISRPEGLTAEQIEAFLAQKEIFVEKRGKKGETKRTDIRPIILSLVPEGEKLFLSMTYGEGRSVRPDQVIQALCGHAGIRAGCPEMTRTALYAQAQDDSFVPLAEAARLGMRPRPAKGLQQEKEETRP